MGKSSIDGNRPLPCLISRGCRTCCMVFLPIKFYQIWFWKFHLAQKLKHGHNLSPGVNHGLRLDWHWTGHNQVSGVEMKIPAMFHFCRRVFVELGRGDQIWALFCLLKPNNDIAKLCGFLGLTFWPMPQAVEFLLSSGLHPERHQSRCIDVAGSTCLFRSALPTISSDFKHTRTCSNSWWESRNWLLCLI